MEETSKKRDDLGKKHGQSRSLDGLDFLATAAGQMGESDHNKNSSNDYTSSSNVLSIPHFAITSSCEIPPGSDAFSTSHVHSQYSQYLPSSNNAISRESQMNFPLKSSTMKELVESYFGSPNSSVPMPVSSQNYYMNSYLPNLCRMNSPTSFATGSEIYQTLSSERTKSAFKAVPPKFFDDNSQHDILKKVMTSASKTSIPDQPPTLFRMEQPATSSSSLFETLVQESQKILSNQEKDQKERMTEFRTTQRMQAHKIERNDNLKLGEAMLVSPPHKKVIKKRRPRSNIVNADGKRAFGGPPFNPEATPPKPNTPESSICTLHEHTLLKMATRGFWSGDRGPLQDVFRLTRVENSDLQYNIAEITEHCYNIVKQKLENVPALSEDRDVMHKHMRCYVDELDSYLERIYPVSSVAINVYLPTAADYASTTWHGIVPTGWSEYRRAVVIREVFEVLSHLSSNETNIPPFQLKFFDRKSPDSTLYPLLINDDKSKETGSGPIPEPKKEVSDDDTYDDIKYSRAFEALWTRTIPHEPFLIIGDTTQMKLREYLEKYPLETNSPPENAIIVIDDKKYKAREVLGFFRRGVQLVDYSKETGEMRIDTISTIKHVTVTSAVRKIPPGKISKLVHPDLHLENYTNAILQIGAIPSQDGSNNQPPVKFRARKRKIKLNSSISGTKKQVKEEINNVIKEEEPSIVDIRKLDSIASFCEPLQSRSGRPEDMSFPSPSLPTGEKLQFPDMMTDIKSYSEQFLQEHGHCSTNSESNNRNPGNKKYSESFLSQFNQDLSRMKPDVPNFHTQDILSSMYVPSGTTGDLFSLHLMIDSYRRAAKYLLDTANHLELVARRGGNISHLKRDQVNTPES